MTRKRTASALPESGTPRTPGDRPADPAHRRTLVRVLIVVSVLLIVAGISVPRYTHAVHSARVIKAVKDLKQIAQSLSVYQLRNGELPADLREIGFGGRRDPWGNPYEYQVLENVGGTIQPSEKWKLMKRGSRRQEWWDLLRQRLESGEQVRKNKDAKPINTLFDLYSVGPDGNSAPKLTAPESLDDVILADDGGYVGAASKY